MNKKDAIDLSLEYFVKYIMLSMMIKINITYDNVSEFIHQVEHINSISELTGRKKIHNQYLSSN